MQASPQGGRAVQGFRRYATGYAALPIPDAVGNGQLPRQQVAVMAIAQAVACWRSLRSGVIVPFLCFTPMLIWGIKHNGCSMRRSLRSQAVIDPLSRLPWRGEAEVKGEKGTAGCRNSSLHCPHATAWPSLASASPPRSLTMKRRRCFCISSSTSSDLSMPSIVA